MDCRCKLNFLIVVDLSLKVAANPEPRLFRNLMNPGNALVEKQEQEVAENRLPLV